LLDLDLLGGGGFETKILLRDVTDPHNKKSSKKFRNSRVNMELLNKKFQKDIVQKQTQADG
jgi:hypothetical protein